MYAELGVALEAAGVTIGEDENLQGVGTVADLAKLAAARRHKGAPRGSAERGGREGSQRPGRSQAEELPSDELKVPAPLIGVGRRVLTWGQRLTYERLFDTQVTGRAYLPQSAPFLVAANHASHLDMGLVKHALGDLGSLLVALAAKDYFFEDRLKRAYFENFTNLIPMDRHGSLRESLRLASQVLRDGYVLLIFPEGTRSTTGVMTDFKASIGYLAISNQVDVVPIYLEGTYDALPKGATLPKKRGIAAHIGPLLRWQRLREATEGMPRAEQYREAARLVEAAVRKLGRLPPPARRLSAPEATE
jgi:long-chain acyl-CoA synthetase